MKQYSIREEIPKEARKELESYSDLVAKLLFHRGIKTKKEAELFLSPDYNVMLHDPFLMKDMDKAVKRILKAIEKNEEVVIFSDYDADGIPGAVALHDFFKKIGFTNFKNYIPHRHDEGFGLNHDAVEGFAKEGAKLIITIDCGIADVSEVEKINSLGMEVIITDHHEPGPKLPPAFAILDSKQKGDKYPFKGLCGSGVVFKLIQAILSKNRFGIKEGHEKWFLDMVGLATIADMVPLVDENRVLAHYGLKVLRKSPRIGLLHMLQTIKVNQRFLSEEDIGFSIVPRINAASRMGIPDDAFKLLATEDEAEAGTLAKHLDKINNERKGIVAQMVKEVRKTISERTKDDPLKAVIVIGNPDWKPSLLGLVANSLVDDHGRCVFLWGRESGDTIKGSCRSDGNMSVVDIMEEAKNVFIDYGGHKMSGGFSVSQEKIHTLEDELIKAYKKIKDKKSGIDEKNYIDHSMSLDDVTWNTYSDIEKISPYGIGNEKPVFVFNNSEIKSIKHFGKENNHLEISFSKKDGKIIKAISFFTTDKDYSRSLLAGEKINLVATLEKSMFRNYPELRLRIIDIY